MGSKGHLYLDRLEKLSESISIMEEEKVALEILFQSVQAIDYEKVKVSCSNNRDPNFVKIEEQISKIESKIQTARFFYVSDGVLLVKKISDLPSSAEQKMVLYKRYIELKSLNEIADEMTLSYSYVKQLHLKGVKIYNQYTT